jgi:hypothetical protein
MSRRSVRIATTHVVPDHPSMALEDLKQHLDTIDHVIIPVYSVHDPRKPPIGRVVSGVIEGLEDGEYALDVNVELFDPDFIPPPGAAVDKRVAIVNRTKGRFGIWCDMFTIKSEIAVILQEISEILETPFSSRSSAGIMQDDLPILIIGIGMLPFGFIADTFSRHLSVEKIHLLTQSLTHLYVSPGEFPADSLLIFDLDVTDRQQRSLLIEVIMTNPDVKDIKTFFSEGFRELDRILPPFYLSRLRPRKIVMNYSDGRFRVLYAIQEQGIPMIPRSESFHG